MPKLFLVVLTAFFSTLTIAEDYAEFKQKVKATVTEFEVIETYIDYSIVPYYQRNEVRDQFKEAYSLLNETLQNIGTDNNQVKEGLQNSYQKIRKAGLMVPFWYIKKDDRDTIIQKFLDAEDKVQSYIANWQLLTNNPNPPPIKPDPVANRKYWKEGTSLWKNVGKHTWANAKKACEELSKTLPEVKNWSLPTYKDLAFTYKKMKDKTQNLLYGEEATKYGKVWTGEKIGGDTDISCIEFQKEEARIAAPTEELDTVCIGKE